MTSTHPVRRSVAALLTSLFLASGLALVPAALVAPSTAAATSADSAARVDCQRLAHQVGKAENDMNNARAVFAKRKVQLDRAVERYNRNPTPANRTKVRQAKKRYDAAGNRKVAAEKRYYKLKQRYERNC